MTLTREQVEALDTFQRLLDAQPHSMGYAQTQEADTLRTALERAARIEAAARVVCASECSHGAEPTLLGNARIDMCHGDVDALRAALDREDG
jgi:hypothetical protein